MSDDELDEEVEDERIGTLYLRADKCSPEEFVALVEKLGTKDAIVYGNLLMDAAVARAMFVVSALLDADDQTIAESITERKVFVHVTSLGSAQLLQLSAFAGSTEGLCCKRR